MILRCVVLTLLWFAPLSYALKVGDPLPNFARPGLLHSDTLRTENLKGRVLYIDFWASWCGPCRVSLPAMDVLFREFQSQGFTVVAVNLDKNENEAQAFLKAHPVSYPLVKDDGSLPKRLGVVGMPTGFLVDHTGLVRAVHEGFRKGDERKLRTQIVRLLEEARQQKSRQ
ncbi:TlpA family protein disulfide reductase [Litorivivens sp.]|uniref:TlpA family protein disulfide reductase n=1 Tax=Litorivivens sp. TaxID=2020868 RepID=UPI00356455BC